MVPPLLRVLRLYWRQYGRLPNLLRPRLFSEKIQHLKLWGRDARLPELSDKVLAKRYVAERLGPEWVTPNLFVGPTLPPLDQRDWPLPYVIKANQQSGGNIFVRSATDVDWPQIEHRLSGWARRAHGRELGEWAYSRIEPQVLVEPFIGFSEPPPDIKFFVFGGRAELIQVHTDRFGTHKQRFYDRDWTPLPYRIKWPLEERPLPRPSELTRMIAAVEALADDLPFVRVDLYEVEGRPRFGEFTFYPDSGIADLDPELDALMGDLWPG